MNTRTRKFLSSALREWLSPVILSALLLALVFGVAPRASAQTPAPPYTPQLTDTEQLTRNAVNGTQVFPTFTLAQEFQFAFGGVTYPQGGASGSYNINTGTFTIIPALFASPIPANGYATGIGTGQSVTQATNKSTAVTFTTGCWTGQITMNNASLASATAVQFTVNDPFIWNTDSVVVTQANNPTHAYVFSTIAQNGSFVVTVVNMSGGSQTDALLLTFLASRASAN